MEFIIENNPNGTLLWWASTKVDGQNIAIGGGHSVWEAIGNCLLYVEPVKKQVEVLREIVSG